MTDDPDREVREAFELHIWPEERHQGALPVRMSDGRYPIRGIQAHWETWLAAWTAARRPDAGQSFSYADGIRAAAEKCRELDECGITDGETYEHHVLSLLDDLSEGPDSVLRNIATDADYDEMFVEPVAKAIYCSARPDLDSAWNAECSEQRLHYFDLASAAIRAIINQVRRPDAGLRAKDEAVDVVRKAVFDYAHAYISDEDARAMLTAALPHLRPDAGRSDEIEAAYKRCWNDRESDILERAASILPASAGRDRS